MHIRFNRDNLQNQLLTKIIEERKNHISPILFNKIVDKFKTLSPDDVIKINEKMQQLSNHLIPAINEARELMVQKTTCASMQHMIEPLNNTGERFYLYIVRCKEYIIDIINMICWTIS